MENVTEKMVDEHRHILRMAALLEEQAARVEEGQPVDWDFFLDAVDFVRHYADRFHHAKEEDILFRELVRNGMPAENSPVGAMRLAHDQGRALVRALEEAAKRAKAGDASAGAAVAENARGYVAFIRNHIEKEDRILYPLAERVLPAGGREAMLRDYLQAVEAAPGGFEERYRLLVERYERAAAA